MIAIPGHCNYSGRFAARHCSKSLRNSAYLAMLRMDRRHLLKLLSGYTKLDLQETWVDCFKLSNSRVRCVEEVESPRGDEALEREPF